jgi:hypothetical protein
MEHDLDDPPVPEIQRWQDWFWWWFTDPPRKRCATRAGSTCSRRGVARIALRETNAGISSGRLYWENKLNLDNTADQLGSPTPKPELAS